MSSRSKAKILISMFGILALVVASSSQAGVVSMYNLGTLTIKAFGNDTTTGSTYPSNTNVYLGLPFGQHCNSAHGTGTTSCGGTYPSAQAGSPLFGGDVVNVTTSSAAPAKFGLAQGQLARKLGTLPTVWNSGPFTTYTRTTSGAQGTMTVYNSNPNHVKIPLNGNPGGSFSYYPPYIYSYSYADLKNQAGNFFGGGGPGSFTYHDGATSVAAKVTPTSANQFGGTMALLGHQTSRAGYFINGGLSIIPSSPWLFQAVGGKGTGNNSTMAYTLTATGTGMHTVLTGTFTEYVRAMAFPWTTGVAQVDAPQGPFVTHMKRTGYDARTAGGIGNIQMVSPMLTHWTNPSTGSDYATGGIGVMKLKFVPEPGSMLLLGAGISLLGLVYRSTRRS